MRSILAILLIACTTVCAADYPTPKDGDWDGPTMLYAIGGRQGIFSELGQGGAAVMNAEGGLSWQTPSRRRHDVYVHVVNQPGLNRRIDDLLAAR